MDVVPDIRIGNSLRIFAIWRIYSFDITVGTAFSFGRWSKSAPVWAISKTRLECAFTGWVKRSQREKMVRRKKCISIEIHFFGPYAFRSMIFPKFGSEAWSVWINWAPLCWALFKANLVTARLTFWLSDVWFIPIDADAISKEFASFLLYRNGADIFENIGGWENVHTAYPAYSGNITIAINHLQTSLSKHAGLLSNGGRGEVKNGTSHRVA